MIAKIMGAGDVMAAIIIAIMSFLPDFLPRRAIILFAGYLLLKGIAFSMSGNFISYLDIACGIYIILMTFGISISVLSLLFVLYLIQKNLTLFFK